MTTVDEPALKTCKFCGETKPDVGFRGFRCKACIAVYWREQRAIKGEEYLEYMREYSRRKRSEDPERYRAVKNRSWLKTMGMTPESYEELLVSQDGKCAICRTDKPGGNGRWHIDHEHTHCGRKRACAECIRGLLCLPCNVSLGYMAEDPDRLVAAADYLRRHAKGKPR